MPDKKGIIFIVDDEPDVANLLSKRVRSAGYETICFYEGSGVVASAERSQPSLILLDIWLPDISGFDLFKQLRSTPATSSISVFFVSADASKEKYSLEELKVEGFIKKPYDPQVLLSQIEQIIKKTTKN